jgi:tetratricopeptide (TPR) repeat protein
MAVTILGRKVKRALEHIRIGQYGDAKRTLKSLEQMSRPSSRDRPAAEQVVLLRLATVQAEIADHDGHYDKAQAALSFHTWVRDELLDTPIAELRVTFDHRTDQEWKLLRQKLYYLWQLSVAAYRSGDYRESERLLTTATRAAESLQPTAHGLLTTLYYGSGKIALHGSAFGRAATMYRKSLVNAAELLTAHRRYAVRRDGRKKTKSAIAHEIRATEYSIGKALALGLGQCLREQGRLEEAHTVVVAGRLLLDLGHDKDLAFHARLLLGSIERGSAGNTDVTLLASARTHAAECVEHFMKHPGDVWLRAHYELALVLMQQGELVQAKSVMAKVLNRASKRDNKKWIANASIGLSRMARRAGLFKDAIADAQKARDVARAADHRKIERRARIALALTLYDAALVDVDPNIKLLEKAESELGRSPSTVAERDLHNRAMLHLVTARVRNKMGDVVGSQRAYAEYQKIGEFVDVGRVRELAERVASEMGPSLHVLQCPADEDVPRYNLKTNVDTLQRHVVLKVEEDPSYSTVNEKARAVGMNRVAYWNLRKRLGLDRPTVAQDKKLS